MVAVLLLFAIIAVGIAVVKRNGIPASRDPGLTNRAVASTGYVNRGVAPRPQFPGPWPLRTPLWTVKEPPNTIRNVRDAVNWRLMTNPVADARTALVQGYRLFPALAPMRNRSSIMTPGIGNREEWERGDSAVALAVSTILFNASESAPRGDLRDALAEGAAGLDAVAVGISMAAELTFNPNDDFFKRMRAKNAAYDARMRKIINEGMNDFYSLNWVGFVAKLFEGGWEVLKGTYAGIKAVFEGSHGGGPPLNVKLLWSAIDADVYAHRAYLAAKEKGYV